VRPARLSRLPVRLCHISKVTGISGAEKHLLTLLGGLDPAGYEITFLLLEEPARPVENYAAKMATAGVQVIRLPVYGHLDPGLLLRIYQHLRGKGYHLVHTHLIHADLYGTLAARLAGVPVLVSTKHNEDAFRRRPFYILLHRLVSRWHQRIIVISDSLGRFTREVEGLDPARMVRIHYGLDPDDLGTPQDGWWLRREFNLPGDAPIVGVVGRLTPQKGHDILLRAFARTLVVHPAACLLVVGDGETRPGLQTLARDLGIGDRVIFTGYREDAPQMMGGFNIVAVPSLWEGFGLVLLEAMAMSRPVVASRVSSIPEIVLDGQTGLLVPPADAAALAEAMAKLLGDPILALEMGRRGRERLLSDFSAERMVRETELVYQGLLGVDGTTPTLKQ
jgi:glycosyltransferase involved in cell wall biosynthesis